MKIPLHKVTLKTDERIENANFSVILIGRISFSREKGKSLVFGEGDILVRLETSTNRTANAGS